MHLDAILEALPTFAAGGNSNNLKSSYRYLQKMKYLEKQNPKVFHEFMGAAASSLGSAVGCRVEGRAIDTALGQCFIPNSSH